ncbi:tripartite motif-containing protein 3-like [Branchiostoma floridae]|uniref:Tripartite motif-containing protein 3-like n=1 Tax=Branchiostoma floridae TaxID=7739 RepID=A0A9J7HGE5_BRAFL|nr:tripartite motif-containing protein 3-like [Branchiostoma floridae]
MAATTGHPGNSSGNHDNRVGHLDNKYHHPDNRSDHLDNRSDHPDNRSDHHDNRFGHHDNRSDPHDSSSEGTTTADRDLFFKVLPEPPKWSGDDQPATTSPPASPSSHGASLPPTTTSPLISNNPQESDIPERIVFGGKGASPGNFSGPSGMAVSADNEIVVADVHNRRVQVFSTEGVFLRLFPAALPGTVSGTDGQLMYPTEVDIDQQGHVWVVGVVKFPSMASAVSVVDYQDGLPVAMFDVKRDASYPKIAVDRRSGKIIVEAASEILMFQPDGSFDRSFKPGDSGILYITTDLWGNIVMTDLSTSVKIYNQAGHLILTFATNGKPLGVSTASRGYIIVGDLVGGRVEVFTGAGEFVRTAADVTNPWAIAVGPAGDLVVTNTIDNVVTIFPRRIVFLVG